MKIMKGHEVKIFSFKRLCLETHQAFYFCFVRTRCSHGSVSRRELACSQKDNRLRAATSRADGSQSRGYNVTYDFTPI